MRTAFFDDHLAFAATAAVAAHAQWAHQGFRQRDVRFLMELFSNWVESSLPGHVIAVQNTQVARYLDGLTTDGYARRIGRRNPPLYLLTRAGLIELLARAVKRPYVHAREQFFFVYYFIHTYRPLLMRLIEDKKATFPASFKLEVEELLDAKAFLARELAAAQKELSKLELRCSAAQSTISYVCRRIKESAPFEEIIAEVQRLYPYELNSQKPLTELMASIPKPWREFEMTDGNQRRLQYIWKAAKAMLEGYLEQLKALG